MVVVSLYRMGWWIFNVKGKANQWFISIIMIFCLYFCACAFPWFYFYSFVQIPITHSLAPFCELIIVITITHSVVFIFRCPPPALISVIQWKVDGFILSRLNIYTSSFFVLKLASFNLDIGMQVSKGRKTQIFSNGILPPHPSHHIWTRKTLLKWTRNKNDQNNLILDKQMKVASRMSKFYHKIADRYRCAHSRQRLISPFAACDVRHDEIVIKWYRSQFDDTHNW